MEILYLFFFYSLWHPSKLAPIRCMHRRQPTYVKLNNEKKKDHKTSQMNRSLLSRCVIVKIWRIRNNLDLTFTTLKRKKKHNNFWNDRWSICRSATWCIYRSHAFLHINMFLKSYTFEGTDLGEGVIFNFFLFSRRSDLDRDWRVKFLIERLGDQQDRSDDQQNRYQSHLFFFKFNTGKRGSQHCIWVQSRLGALLGLAPEQFIHRLDQFFRSTP